MKIIECPRDAMQGFETFIPTARKIAYMNQLLKVGFDEIDFGSFVSPRHIPQLRDTAEVLGKLNWKNSKSKLLVIVANLRGASEACAFEAVSRLGFPMSISETFQKKNTNKSISESLSELEQIINLANKSGKKTVAYISMGFGNPYGDPYEEDLVLQFTEILIALGADIISLADTIGASDAAQVSHLFTALHRSYPDLEIGAHLHTTPQTAFEKINAAYRAGCRRFDGALKGFGGCPMADNELVGNVATETILAVLESEGVQTGIDNNELSKALDMVTEIFPNR
jgi:hydroxymethylglutaryl-CoA lyase